MNPIRIILSFLPQKLPVYIKAQRGRSQISTGDKKGSLSIWLYVLFLGLDFHLPYKVELLFVNCPGCSPKLEAAPDCSKASPAWHASVLACRRKNAHFKLERNCTILSVSVRSHLSFTSMVLIYLKTSGFKSGISKCTHTLWHTEVNFGSRAHMHAHYIFLAYFPCTHECGESCILCLTIVVPLRL